MVVVVKYILLSPFPGSGETGCKVSHGYLAGRCIVVLGSMWLAISANFVVVSHHIYISIFQYSNSMMLPQEEVVSSPEEHSLVTVSLVQ